MRIKVYAFIVSGILSQITVTNHNLNENKLSLIGAGNWSIPEKLLTLCNRMFYRVPHVMYSKFLSDDRY